jgi:hypothetical protein
MDKFEIDRKKFIDICLTQINKTYLTITTSDIDNFSNSCGFEVIHYSTNQIECKIVDKEKLFLFQIKYGL